MRKGVFPAHWAYKQQKVDYCFTSFQVSSLPTIQLTNLSLTAAAAKLQNALQSSWNSICPLLCGRKCQQEASDCGCYCDAWALMVVRVQRKESALKDSPSCLPPARCPGVCLQSVVWRAEKGASLLSLTGITLMGTSDGKNGRGRNSFWFCADPSPTPLFLRYTRLSIKWCIWDFPSSIWYSYVLHLKHPEV